MKSELHVALVQTHLAWEQTKINKVNLEGMLNALSNEVDLIVLPEMFTTGFTMNAEAFAETMTGESVAWMIHLAKKEQAAVTGSLIIKEGNHYYNRLLFVFPDGSYKTYDKRHLFTLAGEDKIYTSGVEKLIVNYKGWKLCPMICYDLRFPVWARNTENYDALIYVANWPKTRIHAWDALLKARAIENMAYCIGVNRVGTDVKGFEYSGHSSVYDVLGDRLDTIQDHTECVEIITLSKSHITDYREKLGFLNDRDRFNLKA